MKKDENIHMKMCWKQMMSNIYGFLCGRRGENQLNSSEFPESIKADRERVKKNYQIL